MLTIRGVYDGERIEPSEEIPFKERRDVIITFLEEPVEETDPGSGVDPIEALRGWAEGLNLGEKLLESRREDVELEELADELGMLKLPYKRIDVEKLG